MCVGGGVPKRNLSPPVYRANISMSELPPSPHLFKVYMHPAWWYMSVIPAFVRPRQENHKFKPNLGYITSKTLSQYKYIYLHTHKVMKKKYYTENI